MVPHCSERVITHELHGEVAYLHTNYFRPSISPSCSNLGFCIQLRAETSSLVNQDPSDELVQPVSHLFYPSKWVK